MGTGEPCRRPCALTEAGARSDTRFAPTEIPVADPLSRREAITSALGLLAAGAVGLPDPLALAADSPAEAPSPPQPGLIRVENQKPGARDWLLTKIESVTTTRPDDRFRRRTAVEGYCSHPSIRPGQTLTVYVSTDPASR